MTTHLITTDFFYILSGPSASGKSTLTQKLLEQGLSADSIVSPDSFRKQILGYYPKIDENGVYDSLYGWEMNQAKTFALMDEILRMRFKEKLPTFFDATSLTDAARSPYVKLAQEYGISTKVIIFDTPTEQLKSRLSKRRERFDWKVVESQIANFQKTSRYEHIILKGDEEFILSPQLINTHKLDVIGDTHGLLDYTVAILKEKGWNFDGNYFSHSDNERKILFLGDAVDRGFQSLDLLNAIYHTCSQNKSYFILGNHEQKLIQSYLHYKEHKEVKIKSLSSGQTLMQFLKLSSHDQENLFKFLNHAPAHLSLWYDKKTNQLVNFKENINSSEILKFGFVHADSHFYDPYKYAKSFAIYGSSAKKRNVDNDSLYEQGYEQGINEHILIRGHIPNTSVQNHVYSLDEKQAFEGNLVVLSMDKLIEQIKENNYIMKHEMFLNNLIKYKSNFNFDKEMEIKMNLLKEMEKLVDDGVVHDGLKRDDETKKKIPHPLGLRIFKYKKKVFFKKLWPKYPMLKKARGLVMDAVGNIVVHPFDKIYNYGEYDTGSNLKQEKIVQAVEKKNGFLGCISPHPTDENEVLASTTGSLDSDFVKYIHDFITPELKSKLIKHFKSNPQTLMFEVLHPEDKHVIEYKEEEYGLCLIGARGLKEDSSLIKEADLDILATELNFSRPYWFEDTFENILTKLKSVQHEGYMIREKDTHETIMKIKSTYYLTTKFVSRMGPNNIKLMFGKPEKFKEDHMDEEFFPVVDKIVSSTTQEEFGTMEPGKRVEFVRSLVNNLRKEFDHTQTEAAVKNHKPSV